MRYLGSKKRVGPHLLPFILPHLKGRHYVEPFVGGGEMMAHIPHDTAESRTGYDSSMWAIRALRMIRDRADELPRDNAEFTKEMYEHIRANRDTLEDKQFAAYVLFACSFGGKFADSWSRLRRGAISGKHKTVRQTPRGSTCAASLSDAGIERAKRRLLRSTVCKHDRIQRHVWFSARTEKLFQL